MAEFLAALAGAVGGDLAVLLSPGPADVAPSAAVRHVAELFDVDVDQGAGAVVLIAADRLPGDPVDTREPVDLAPDQHLVDRGRGEADLRCDLDRPEPVLPSQVHDLADHGPGGTGRASAAAGRTRRPYRPGPAAGSGRPIAGRWATTRRSARSPGRPASLDPPPAGQA